MYKQVNDVISKAIEEHGFTYTPGSMLLSRSNRNVFIEFLGDVNYEVFLKMTPQGKFWLRLSMPFMIPNNTRILGGIAEAAEASAADTLKGVCERMDTGFKEFYNDFLMKCCKYAADNEQATRLQTHHEYNRTRGFKTGTYKLSDELFVDFNPFVRWYPIILRSNKKRHRSKEYRSKSCWPWDFKRTLIKL